MEWYNRLLIGVIVLIFIVILRYIYVAGNIKDGLTNFATALGFDMGTPLECDDKTEIKRLGLCYQKCKEPYSVYDAETKQCVYPVPINWPGTYKSTDIQNDMVHYPLKDLGTAPKCENGLLMSDTLCYTAPPGLRMVQPGLAGESCESLLGVYKFDGIDNGTSCTFNPDVIDRAPYTYDYRPEAQPYWDHTERAVGFKLFDRKGDKMIYTCDLIKFNLDKQGTYKLDPDTNTCVRQPQTIPKQQLRTISGTLPTYCGAGKELVGNLCYPDCNTAARSVGKQVEYDYMRYPDNADYCYTKCPPGYPDNKNFGCSRPSIDAGPGIKPHTCNNKKIKKNGLCFLP